MGICFIDERAGFSDAVQSTSSPFKHYLKTDRENPFYYKNPNRIQKEPVKRLRFK